MSTKPVSYAREMHGPLARLTALHTRLGYQEGVRNEAGIASALDDVERNAEALLAWARAARAERGER